MFPVDRIRLCRKGTVNSQADACIRRKTEGNPSVALLPFLTPLLPAQTCFRNILTWEGGGEGRIKYMSFGRRENDSMPVAIYQVSPSVSLSLLHNCLPSAAARGWLKMVLSTSSFLFPRQRSSKKQTGRHANRAQRHQQ